MEQVALADNLATDTRKLLPKIAKCESDLDPTAVHYNKNNTEDYSVLQINSVHIPQMKKFGLDYYNWRDSVIYGIYLASSTGLRPWKSSEWCWDKK